MRVTEAGTPRRETSRSDDPAIGTAQAGTEPSGDWSGDPAPRRRSRRVLAGRLSSGHVVMLVAAVTAALANIAVLTAGDDGVTFLVAARDLAAGESVDAAAVVERTGTVDDEVLATLLTPTSLDTVEGHVITGPIAAGAPVRTGDLRAPAGAAGQRRISIPVERAQAVSGQIVVGDRIDVIRVDDGVARYIVGGAPVMAVDGGAGDRLGAPAAFSVTTAVDADTALCLAAAIERGGVTIVLATGQEPLTPAGCSQDPAASVGSGGESAAAGDATAGDAMPTAEPVDGPTGSPTEEGRQQ